jgi:ribA/ribD-fused uncharacterized protein
MFIKNWFSNMLPLDEPFEYPAGDGTTIQFKTIENFYVAMKTEKDDIETRRLVATLEPHAAKRFGKKIVLRKDWHDIHVDVMRHALKIKFTAGTSWHEKLIATTGEIVEWNNWNDQFWGAIATLENGVVTPVVPRRGKNMLGILLMEIRDSHR